MKQTVTTKNIKQEVKGSPTAAAQIVKHAPQQATVVPEYLVLPPGSERPGFEEMEQSDIIMPRLALCQSGTPQRKKSEEKYIEGLDEAMYFNTITRKIYGEKIIVVPLMFFTSRILFGENMGDPLPCQALDGKTGIGNPGGACIQCPLKEFGTSKKQGSKAPACTKLYNYAVLVADEQRIVHAEDLAVFTMKSSGANDAMGWNTLMRLRAGTPMYAGMYELFSMPATNGTNSWHAPKVQNAGWVSKDSADAARAAHEAISALRSQGRLQHDISDLGPQGDATEDKPPF